MRESSNGQKNADAYRHADPVVDQALDWLVRMEAGGLVDKRTKAQFEDWLAAAPDHRAAWEDVQATWSSPETLVAAQELDISLREQPVPISAARAAKPRQRLVSYSMAAAASVVVVVSATYLASQWLPRMMADYATNVAQMRDFTLPDGSRMVLNTDSAVALDFAEGKRGVRLIEGEAWFDVVHDAARPFHVTAHYSDVQVKGTAFSVRVDDGGDTVSLQRGAVDARHERSDIALVHLVPGQMVTASSRSMSPVTQFDAEQALGWLQGRVVIDAKPLGTALAEVGRYFDGKVFVLNKTLLDKTVSGDYRTDHAATAIVSLAAAAGGEATVLPGGFIIIR